MPEKNAKQQNAAHVENRSAVVSSTFDSAHPCEGPAPQNQAYPIPHNEQQRLDSLWSLNILDTAPDERFTRIARLAAGHFKMPLCFVSFVDKDRNWFKVAIGATTTQAPRGIAICSHAIMEGRVLVSHDLTMDSRFTHNPQVVSDPKFRFYAGAPIILQDGMRVGSLCVIDYIPHPEFSKDDANYLEDLAKIVVDELELNKQIVDRNKKLELAGEELDIAKTAKSRFMTIVSHELRTPLNAIMGFGQIIASGGAEAGNNLIHSEYAKHICDASERLAALVDRIILYSSAKTDELKLCEVEIKVEAFLTKCINIAAGGMKGRQVSISLSKSTDAPETIYADEILIGEVIYQLLNNAIRHTKMGTEISVSMKMNELGGLSISILDFGEGIPSARLEHAFDAFSQCDEGLTRNHEGVGLGLSLTKSLMGLHGGSLHLKSHEDGGVCAEIVFPLCRSGSKRPSLSGKPE